MFGCQKSCTNSFGVFYARHSYLFRALNCNNEGSAYLAADWNIKHPPSPDFTMKLTVGGSFASRAFGVCSQSWVIFRMQKSSRCKHLLVLVMEALQFERKSQESPSMYLMRIGYQSGSSTYKFRVRGGSPTKNLPRWCLQWHQI
ncbi:hypothetical protein M758_7G080300 [Ceratodon purpureus]|uniref:Uncharacterized protein n=1 Tax=Ceratodon purpureus TaxID=3225 RepID=A0A8T0HCD3_CERPU|nr:hypothetical protein KC19_7G085300 [Ceratodon purpureus]KAG0610636.1 hypothetical protein M758_7G080300 [Ceratodon purpureus]